MTVTQDREPVRLHSEATHLALGVGDTQWTLVYASQQSSHGKAVAAHSLRWTLQVVDSLCTAVQQWGQLIGQRHSHTAQAPRSRQASCHAWVQQHWGHSLKESWGRGYGICFEMGMNLNSFSLAGDIKSNMQQLHIQQVLYIFQSVKEVDVRFT